MSDTDEMTDAALRELRAAIASFPVPEPPSVGGIRARGSVRRRRRYGVAVGSAAGLAALGTGLAFGTTGTHHATSTSTLRTIRTAAYTLVSNPDGTATLTMSPKELFDPTALQNDLASYGIPAKVTSGSFCTSDPEPNGFAQVVSLDPGTGEGQDGPGRPATVTIDPSAMPAGTELSIGEFPLPRGLELSSTTLIDANSYTCTTTVPTDGPGQGNGFAFIMIPSNAN